MINNLQRYRKSILVSGICIVLIGILSIISFNFGYFNKQVKSVSQFNYQTESLMVKYANSKLTNQNVVKKINLKKTKQVIVSPETKISVKIKNKYKNIPVITSFSKTGQQLVKKYNLYNTDFQLIDLTKGKVTNLNLYTATQLPDKKVKINQDLKQLKQQQAHLVKLAAIRSWLISSTIIVTIIYLILIWLLYR